MPALFPKEALSPPAPRYQPYQYCEPPPAQLTFLVWILWLALGDPQGKAFWEGKDKVSTHSVQSSLLSSKVPSLMDWVLEQPRSNMPALSPNVLFQTGE